MCGIAGIVSVTGAAAPPALDALERMAGALSHRGPDEFGVYRDQRAGLAQYVHDAIMANAVARS